ncbi:MAG: TolC family protein [Alistipes sp.]
MKRFIIYIALSLTVCRVAAQTELLSMDQYRQRVLDYSIQLKQSGEQIESVRQAMREAKTSFLPKLDFSGSAQYRINDYNLDLAGAKMSMPGETYALDVDLSQVIYAGGAVKQGFQAAKIQHNIAQKNEELTVSNVVYSANRNYWGAAAKHALYLLTSRYVQLIEEQTTVIDQRFKEGLISKTDLLQIQARLSEAKIQNSEAYKSYQLAMQNLNIMMGCDPLQQVEMSDLISREDVIPTSILSLDETLDRRAEFRISEMNVDYQLRQLKIQRSKFLPQLAIGMKEGWGTQMLNFDGSTMFNTYAYASLKIPIFRWGAKYKNVASQRALLRSRELDVQQTRDRISQELYSAYTNLVEYRKQIVIAEQSCAISKESMELNTFSYNEGKLPIIDVLSAQVVWVQANSALIQAWLQEKVAYADYNKATGNQQY